MPGGFERRLGELEWLLEIDAPQSGERALRWLRSAVAALERAPILPPGRGTQDIPSPEWCAPEQGMADPTTDVWGLGLLAFRLLTGRSYWRAEGFSGLALEARNGAPVRASQRARELGSNVTLPPGFDRWFARCVCHRSERFPAPAVALAALSPLLIPVARPTMEPRPPSVRVPLPLLMASAFGAGSWVGLAACALLLIGAYSADDAPVRAAQTQVVTTYAPGPRVVVHSAPTGAEVWAEDGVFLGHTPISLPPPSTLRLVYPGYGDVVVVVDDASVHERLVCLRAIGGLEPMCPVSP